MGKTKKTFKSLGCITLGASIALVAPTAAVAAGAAVGTGCAVAAVCYRSKKKRRTKDSNTPTPNRQAVPDRRQERNTGTFSIEKRDSGPDKAQKEGQGQEASEKKRYQVRRGAQKIVLILGVGAASACLGPWSCIYLGVSMTTTACVAKRLFKTDSKTVRSILQFLQAAGIEIAVGGVSRGLVSALRPVVALFVGLVLWWIGSTLDKNPKSSLAFVATLGQEITFGAAFRMAYDVYLLYQGHKVAINTFIISQFGNNKFTILETAAAYTSLRSMLIMPQKDFVELLETIREHVSHGLELFKQAKQCRDEQKREQLQSTGNPVPSIAA